MEEKYNKAFKEVMEILKYVPEESVNEIPKEMLEMFKRDMDVSYDFSIDETKELEQQNLMEETKAILSNIYRDYWATSEQRQEIIKNEQIEREELENKKREKYNPDDLFKNRNRFNKSINEQEEVQTNLPAKVKKKNFYTKLVSFIKNILKLN